MPVIDGLSSGFLRKFSQKIHDKSVIFIESVP